MATSTTLALLALLGLAAGQDAGFECAWRSLAYDYGRELLPAYGTFPALFDALQLASLCNHSRPQPPADDLLPAPLSGSPRKVGNGDGIYVDPAAGSDSNPGTETQPLATILAAVKRARETRLRNIVLRGGFHELNETIALGPDDSGLNFLNYPQERPVVSGGKALKLQWTPYNVTPGECRGGMCVFANQNGIYGETPSPSIRNITRTPTADKCAALCNAEPTCRSFTWHDATYPIEWNQTCWFRSDLVYRPTTEEHHVAGCKLGQGVSGCTDPAARNIYVADVRGQDIRVRAEGAWWGWPSGQQQGTADEAVEPLATLHYRTPDGKLHRAIRARYPNGDPELIPNYLSAGSWLPPSGPGCDSADVIFPFPENYAGMFQDFRLGVEGTCSRYEADPSSYWCQPGGRTGGKTYCVRSPSGLVAGPSVLPHSPYKNVSGAVIAAFRGDGEWFTWFWRVQSMNRSGSVRFGRGGFQGAEGADRGGRWYIENVFEELDAPEEYFYDPVNEKLYYFNNASGSPPPTTTFVAPILTQLFVLRGGQDHPVVGVTFSGLTFTATASTVLSPHAVPSGGDWALEPQGALTFMGTIGTQVSNCVFERLDGNAVFLGGFNRNASISASEFAFIGNNAVALWGNTEYYDGTNGDQPRYTTMSDCLCREIGHYQKQSSCFFQAKSTRSVVTRNVMFNMPRAAINFNDGFGGGNVIDQNLVFNTCRESSDHGPFNSWDRQPFLTMERDGKTPSLIPAYNNISNNFMVANYNADGGCLDNDDGSSWYNNYDNFFIYGGHKSDFDGHEKRSFGNVMLYPNVYGKRCIGIFGMPHPGYEEGFWNNTCVLSPGAIYADLGGCSLTQPSTWTIVAHSNTVYASEASVDITCGTTISLAKFSQHTGLEQGTTVHPPPTNQQMMAWGRSLLWPVRR